MRATSSPRIRITCIPARTVKLLVDRGDFPKHLKPQGTMESQEGFPDLMCISSRDAVPAIEEFPHSPVPPQST